MGDDFSAIDRVTNILSNDSKLTVSKYTFDTKKREEVLAEFQKGTYSTLVAIKCFDEGLDVPSLDKLYILASDGSKRQTIQRRGRVLRVCKESGKTKAIIYDMIVLPPECSCRCWSRLLENELIRFRAYSELADNKEELFLQIKQLEEFYNKPREEAK